VDRGPPQRPAMRRRG